MAHQPAPKSLRKKNGKPSGGQTGDPGMLSGNTSDRRWNTDWVERLGQDFPEDFWRGRCDIADSAMMSEPTITQISAR